MKYLYMIELIICTVLLLVSGMANGQVNTVTICEDKWSACGTMTCASGKIEIITVRYGRRQALSHLICNDGHFDFKLDYDCDEGPRYMDRIKLQCEGKSTCHSMCSGSWWEPCINIPKVLEIDYRCGTFALPTTGATASTTKTSPTTTETTNSTVNASMNATAVSSTQTKPTIAILITTVLIVVPVTIVTVYLLYLRFRNRRESAELEKKIQSGVIPIQCNVIAIVDDVDEFKDYTKRLMIALQDRFPKLVFKRVSKYDVLNYDYELKCDKVLLFQRTNNAKLKSKSIAAITKKVRFQHNRSVVVIDVGIEVESTIEESEMVDEICMVPSLKHIDGWLPAVFKTCFDVRGNCFSMLTRTYVVLSEETVSRSENCVRLQHAVENILTFFGATVASSENVATCKIVFLESKDDNFLTNDETRNKANFIFLSSVTSLGGSSQRRDMNVYGRKDMILGIVRLLFKLNLISCKRLPNIKAMMYNPRTKAFV